MEVAIFQFSLFGINTYVVYDDASHECAVIDPGMIDPEEEKAMTDFIERKSLKVVDIINTHLHIDHAVGVNFLHDRYKAPVLAHEADLPLGQRMQQQATMFGIGRKFSDVTVTDYLSDGDTVSIGSGKLEVICVPGHSAGSIALYDKKDGFVIVGDALFRRSIGRTDLPGGDYATLISSLKNRLLSLPDDTVVYPGHGDPTTIGEERRLNPYLS